MRWAATGFSVAALAFAICLFTKGAVHSGNDDLSFFLGDRHIEIVIIVFGDVLTCQILKPAQGQQISACAQRCVEGVTVNLLNTGLGGGEHSLASAVSSRRVPVHGLHLNALVERQSMQIPPRVLGKLLPMDKIFILFPPA